MAFLASFPRREAEDSPSKSSSDKKAGKPSKKKKARWTDGRNGSDDTKDRTVYVKQIPYAATEKDIKRHFKAASVRLLRDGETKKSRGQAFVELRSSEEAKPRWACRGACSRADP